MPKNHDFSKNRVLQETSWNSTRLVRNYSPKSRYHSNQSVNQKIGFQKIHVSKNQENRISRFSLPASSSTIVWSSASTCSLRKPFHYLLIRWFTMTSIFSRSLYDSRSIFSKITLACDATSTQIHLVLYLPQEITCETQTPTDPVFQHKQERTQHKPTHFLSFFLFFFFIFL